MNETLESLSLMQTLRRIWTEERRSFGFSQNYQEALCQLTANIFNPAKNRGSLLQCLAKMPKNSNFLSETLAQLEKRKLIINIQVTDENKVTITPEGLIALALFDDPSIRDLDRIVYELYREHCFHQIERLRKKETLKPKHVGVLLFFLINGSFDREKAYVVETEEDKKCIDRVVKAFLECPNSPINETYALEYYLVEAKRILGDVLFNERPIYFLRTAKLDSIIKTIVEVTKQDPNFALKWENLKMAYQTNLTYIRARKNSFYSASWELALEKQLLSPSEYRGL